MSPFARGLIVGIVGYWAVQHFLGVGNTGKAKAG
jgi:hypothetical protein